MEQKFIDKLFLSLNTRLKTLNPDNDYSGALAEIMSTIALLKKEVLISGFNGEADEINFFKRIKPMFYSLFIYTVEQRNLISALPIAPLKELREYYIKELSFISRFFDQHAFPYQYFLLKEDNRDEEFFLRKNLDLTDLSGQMIPDDGFSSQMDYLFAKFTALERLRFDVVKRINELDLQKRTVELEQSSSAAQLVWTAEKIDLVELVYGLYFMKSINGGKADLADIVSWVERSLSVDLGYVYRKFLDVSRRKMLSHTRYLDEMQKRIYKHILDRDGVKQQ